MTIKTETGLFVTIMLSAFVCMGFYFVCVGIYYSFTLDKPRPRLRATDYYKDGFRAGIRFGYLGANGGHSLSNTLYIIEDAWKEPRQEVQ